MQVKLVQEELNQGNLDLSPLIKPDPDLQPGQDNWSFCNFDASNKSTTQQNHKTRLTAHQPYGLNTALLQHYKSQVCYVRLAPPLDAPAAFPPFRLM